MFLHNNRERINPERKGKGMYYRWLVIVFTALVLFACATTIYAQEEKSRKDLSLRKLSATADRIFVGIVRKVEVAEIKLTAKEEDAPVKVQEVTFEIKMPLRGNMKPGDRLRVRQFYPYKSSVAEGEELLWFLPKNSSTGFVAPIAIASGHFIIQEDLQDKRYRITVNLANNGALWPAKTSLWSKESGLEREAFKKILEGMVPAERVEAIMKIADAPYRSQVLPLEMVIAATKLYLQQKTQK